MTGGEKFAKSVEVDATGRIQWLVCAKWTSAKHSGSFNLRSSLSSPSLSLPLPYSLNTLVSISNETTE